MKEKLWQVLTCILGWTWVQNKVFAYAFKRPYDQIGDYMQRWWLVPFDSKLPFAIRINHIKKPDADIELHDHPWDWRTIVLTGWYDEEDVNGNIKTRMAGDTTGRRAEEFHRVTKVDESGAYTMFITFKYRNRWGFMTNTPAGPRKIYWKDFH